jgi:acyl-CoA synthetase (NDP forming)
MSVRNLQHLFAPRSVALIGASDRPGSLGATLLGNLKGGGFRGPIYPVNPKHAQVGGLKAYAGVSQLPEVPDLAVISLRRRCRRSCASWARAATAPRSCWRPASRKPGTWAGAA